MREIKFRAWCGSSMVCWNEIVGCLRKGDFEDFNDWNKMMQYTGLKDKNGNLTEIYEGDFIDINGKIIGNLYQNNDLLKDKTNLLIQDFGGKTWCATYKEALERGCEHSE